MTTTADELEAQIGIGDPVEIHQLGYMNGEVWAERWLPATVVYVTDGEIGAFSDGERRAVLRDGRAGMWRRSRAALIREGER